jgi:hypothetical protein
MPQSRSVEEVLGRAEGLEKKYDWLKAAELYEQALRGVGKSDFLRRGEIQEKIGFCFKKAAMQAGSQEEFQDGMHRTVEAYEKARGFHEKLMDAQKAPRISRCDAVAKYLGYWLAPDSSEKKRLLTECWKLTKEALQAFAEAGDALEYGKTFNQLSSSAFLGYALEWDFQASEKTIREAMERGEQAVNLLSSVGDSDELARALVKAAFYSSAFGYYFIPDMDVKERYYRKGQGYWRKACELSEEAALLELSSTSCRVGDEFGWNYDEIIMNFNKALDHAKKTEDNYMIGTAQDWLVYASIWKTAVIDDLDKRVEALQRILQYAEDAKQHFSSISFVSPSSAAGWTGGPQSWYYGFLGIWEIDLRRKRDLLEKALMYGTQELELAESTGYPAVICYVHHGLGRLLELSADIEPNVMEKRRILRKALEHREESNRIAEQICIFEYWNLGMHRVLLARLKAKLAYLEKDSEKRQKVLEEAITNMEHGLQLMIKEILYWERTGELSIFENFGRLQLSYGELLFRLHGLTNNDEHQRKGIKALEEATESFQKLNLFSRIAECYWKIAGCYDVLGEHPKATENFNLASANYANAAEKIPQLENFYKDYACYMQAWSEIEKARHYHRRQEYGQAKEHYKKAADLHTKIERWSHLSPNYLAWARLEEAEDLSRREQTEEAQKLFQQAAELFVEARKSIKAKLKKIEAEDERQMAAELVKASDTRRDYCLGRVALEEAKILDRKGDHAASSRKYGSATARFQKAVDAMERESDRQELRAIVYLCQAWQTMTQAEAEASPDLYLEASQLFDQAKEYSVDENAKLLSLGHSSFCKALEAGTRFEATGDITMHSTAKKHLEASARYYLKAGFKNASEYAKATQRLFDAYMYMHNADTEKDLKKRAELYQIADKFLQASAGSYMKAKHPEKSEEVQRLLESVREEQQLAISLTGVLHAPTTTSTTTSFSTPTPTHEQAAGLQRFERADIQATLLLRVTEANVGEDIGFRMELVNAGKAPALLIKVDEIAPESFEIKEVPEICAVEDSYLDLKGRRLNPLKTVDIKLTVKPQSKGTFSIKPRVLYIDETGKYNSHEPEPVTITVKELGISGWIKGEK